MPPRQEAPGIEGCNSVLVTLRLLSSSSSWVQKWAQKWNPNFLSRIDMRKWFGPEEILKWHFGLRGHMLRLLTPEGPSESVVQLPSNTCPSNGRALLPSRHRYPIHPGELHWENGLGILQVVLCCHESVFSNRLDKLLGNLALKTF